MSRRARAVLAAILGVSLVSGRARAAYDDVGISARATGLGMAYTAVADDAYTIYYNPAGLATLDRPEFASTYSRLLTGLSVTGECALDLIASTARCPRSTGTSVTGATSHPTILLR